MKRFDLTTRSESVSVALGHQRSATLPPGAVLKALASATAAALLLLPQAHIAQAQTIGDLDVRSRLGERFFGAIPVRTENGILDPRCIRVVANPNAPAGAEPLQGARVRIGSADSVIIETIGTVMSPVVGLRLEVGCEQPVTRDFLVLKEGESVPGVAQTAPAAPVPSEATAAAPAGVEPAMSTRSAAAVAPRAPAQRTTPRRAPTRAAQSLAGAAPIAAPPAPRAAAPAPSPAQARPALAEAAAASATDQDAARRVADLRARSDDHAAAMLALDDRLALLQKQADVLKAQLEQMLVQAPAAHAPAGASTTGAQANAVGVAPGASAPTSVAAPASSSPAAVAAASGSAPVANAGAARQGSSGVLDVLTDWRVAAGISALLLAALGLKLRRRPLFQAPQRQPSVSPARATPWARATSEPPEGAVTATASSLAYDKTQQMPSVAQPYGADRTTELHAAAPIKVDQTAEWVPPPTTDTLPLPEAAGSLSPAGRALPGAGISREFHITQQFQPAAERVVALSSPEEIVQQARTHYMDDGDVFRAIDLLEMAVAARKDSPRPFQALFAIYRRETMPERFQRLALAYRGSFGQDEHWPVIRALGQDIDPANPLYAGEDAPAKVPEDLIERWLGVPLDFTAHLLANEMHDQLMSTHPGLKRRKRLARE
ncbi:MAG: hypothetical protein IT531_06475 [Burkholderiales bacterium]|nr:hypothetical protein [Burkholderiales bacterium]